MYGIPMYSSIGLLMNKKLCREIAATKYGTIFLDWCHRNRINWIDIVSKCFWANFTYGKVTYQFDNESFLLAHQVME